MLYVYVNFKPLITFFPRLHSGPGYPEVQMMRCLSIPFFKITTIMARIVSPHESGLGTATEDGPNTSIRVNKSCGVDSFQNFENENILFFFPPFL